MAPIVQVPKLSQALDLKERETWHCCAGTASVSSYQSLLAVAHLCLLYPCLEIEVPESEQVQAGVI